GVGGARDSGRRAPLRSVVLGRGSGQRARRQDVPRRAESELARSASRIAGRAEPEAGGARTARPVRSSRLLRRRYRFTARRARVQSHRLTERHLGEDRAEEFMMPWRLVLPRCILVPIVAIASTASAQQVVRYEPAERDLKFVYATVPPVATLKPGDT